MNSSENSPATPPMPPVKPRGGAATFWPAPSRAGWVGARSGAAAVLLPNHQATVRAWQEQNPGMTALVLECGGYPVAAAAAFGFVTRKKLEAALSPAGEGSETASRRLYVPVSFAQQLHLAGGDDLQGWKVALVPDQPTALRGSTGEPAAAGTPNMWVVRLAAALRLWLGQVLVFSVPLFIFGWQAWLIGILALLLSALILAVTWRLLPGPGWAKGLLLGVLAGAGAAAALWFGLQVEPAGLLPAAGVGLLFAWMGPVLAGLRKA